MQEEINVLIVGGKGNIGSGLRTYMPKLNPAYQFVSLDLPEAEDRAQSAGVAGKMLTMDVMAEQDTFRSMLAGVDLVVYLARCSGLAEMNTMTDMVFQAVRDASPSPMIVGASSVHAVDGAYNFYRHDDYALIAQRKFGEIANWPDLLNAEMAACPINDYGHEKAYVEEWCRRLAKDGISAIAARWGGINAANSAIANEAAYFSVWCHQEDAARFVHACYESHVNGSLPSGSHYFVISDNTYSIFDIATARRQVGYDPIHNAETYYD
ncbi:MAG: hypothetical protein HOH43_14720 [Candidatus Latescibacteria bacterium]|jgi:nucleoside-diphosphate-sugar epimerase|nr:hypothetical protein [Candidatus Latescibacterota bacterium]